MTRLTVMALVIIAFIAPAVHSQPGFTELALSDTTLNSDPSTDFWIASAAPADVDADGDLDLLVAGYYVIYFVSAEDRLVLYRNDGAVDNSIWALSTAGARTPRVGLSFSGVRPNPFSGTANLEITLGREERGSVIVYDVRGQRVTTLHDGAFKKGTNIFFSFNGTRLPSGVYFIRATTSRESVTRRVNLVH